MKANRAQIKLILTKDLMFMAPLWALLILIIWGAITFAMFWMLLNVIKPSIDRRMQQDQKSTIMIAPDSLHKSTITNNIY